MLHRWHGDARHGLFGGPPWKKLLDIRTVEHPSLVAGPVFKTGEVRREAFLASSIPVLYRHQGLLGAGDQGSALRGDFQVSPLCKEVFGRTRRSSFDDRRSEFFPEIPDRNVALSCFQRSGFSIAARFPNVERWGRARPDKLRHKRHAAAVTASSGSARPTLAPQPFAKRPMRRAAPR